MWWDIRKLVEPVETLQLEYAGYMPGQKLGGIVMEYESTMVSELPVNYLECGKPGDFPSLSYSLPFLDFWKLTQKN